MGSESRNRNYTHYGYPTVSSGYAGGSTHSVSGAVEREDSDYEEEDSLFEILNRSK